MFEFVAFMFIPINFFYFSVCFFKFISKSKRDQVSKLVLTVCVLPNCFLSFFKAFETVHSATPLQLMYFVSCIFVFVTAGKVLAQHQWQRDPEAKAVRHSV
jgi:uncharacterized membrane protein YoaK (UPF0700 family)